MITPPGDRPTPATDQADRARATRSGTVAEDSAGPAPVSSCAAVSGSTTTCMSIRSSSAPDSLPR